VDISLREGDGYTRFLEPFEALPSQFTLNAPDLERVFRFNPEKHSEYKTVVSEFPKKDGGRRFGEDFFVVFHAGDEDVHGLINIGGIADAYFELTTYSRIAQGPVDHLLFKEFGVGDKYVDAVEALELLDAGRRGHVDLGQPVADHVDADEDLAVVAQRRADGGTDFAVALGQLGGQFDFADWEQPDSQPRGAARLYLPGSECLYEIVGYEPAATAPPAETAPPAPPEGFRAPAAPPPTTAPPAPPPGTVPPETVPTTTLPPVPIFGQVESGTTIAPDVLDPNAPLPSAPVGQLVRPCR